MVGARSTPGHQRVWLWRVSQPGETTKGTLHGARGKRPLSVSFAYGTTNAGDDEHISEKDVMSDAFWIALFAGLPALLPCCCRSWFRLSKFLLSVLLDGPPTWPDGEQSSLKQQQQ